MWIFQLLAGGVDPVDAHLSDIRSFVTQRLGNLRTVLSGDPVPARKALLKHVSEIRMVPQAGDGKPHYVAEGNWNLLGHEKEEFAGDTTSRQIRVVAGVGFEPDDPLGYETTRIDDEGFQMVLPSRASITI
jgi:hypothetical protein